MDYFIPPDDFVKDRTTFSEKCWRCRKRRCRLPRPFKAIERPASDGIVRVAIPASTMKLNPKLFEAIGRIAKGAKSKLEIQFFPLAGTGLPYVELTRAVKSWILGAGLCRSAA